ncbi:hypothetical protein JAG27_002758 [Proteus mirabilis]|uniref:hypothetical protein n=1 Tax=Proteus mirabilis TaxID=584 RepID=UPI0003629321|nr:hypothetical protein [Proteus mirabilis]AWR58577.1 hypothetical protein CLH65_04065 [Proteus mirabilis]EGT0658992.1 hypothetical protein [Proteus mirabilis]EKW0401570.1 hypothetical protein [Proteus mirabilis]EKW4513423.1 hypothetical protein [Proteus mirabilis]EKY1725383.1 hypothetical protein [Proteus mirabilis]
MNIEKISSILKENEWCDMEICGFCENDLVVKGCLEITDQDYFIEFRFRNASYIDAPLSWTMDTTENCIFKAVDKNYVQDNTLENQKYFSLGGLYIFSFLAEFFYSKEWVNIVADSVEYKLIHRY